MIGYSYNDNRLSCTSDVRQEVGKQPCAVGNVPDSKQDIGHDNSQLNDDRHCKTSLCSINDHTSRESGYNTDGIASSGQNVGLHNTIALSFKVEVKVTSATTRLGNHPETISTQENSSIILRLTDMAG